MAHHAGERGRQQKAARGAAMKRSAKTSKEIGRVGAALGAAAKEISKQQKKAAPKSTRGPSLTASDRALLNKIEAEIEAERAEQEEKDRLAREAKKAEKAAAKAAAKAAKAEAREKEQAEGKPRRFPFFGK